MIDLTTKLAGIGLNWPAFNASGPKCSTLEELNALGDSASAVIMSKSMTLEAREGNPEPRYADFEGGSINSMGLPNLGYEKYLEILPRLKKFNKPVFASIAGLSLKDDLRIIEAFNGIEVDALEINLSCPNVPGKPQVAYDFEASQKYLAEIALAIKKPWGVKLPPYFDFSHFEQMAKILNETSPGFVSCVNSPGNGLVIDWRKEQTLIRPKRGFGGIGGKIIKPFGLANVRKFRELLKPEIQIVGVGGITQGSDIFEYILAGATAVQIGTAFHREEGFVFKRLKQELTKLMADKGYTKLGDFYNRLKIAQSI